MAFVDGPIKNMPKSSLECKNHTLFETKRAKIDTLILSKTAKNPYPWGSNILRVRVSPYTAREYPLPELLIFHVFSNIQKHTELTELNSNSLCGRKTFICLKRRALFKKQSKKKNKKKTLGNRVN